MHHLETIIVVITIPLEFVSEPYTHQQISNSSQRRRGTSTCVHPRLNILGQSHRWFHFTSQNAVEVDMRVLGISRDTVEDRRDLCIDHIVNDRSDNIVHIARRYVLQL